MFEHYDWSLSVLLQDILSGCKETLSLSEHSGVVLERLGSLSLQSSSFLDSSTRDSSPGLLEETLASVSSSGSFADLNSRPATLSATPSLKNDREQASLPSWIQTDHLTEFRMPSLKSTIWSSDCHVVLLMCRRLLMMRRRMKVQRQTSAKPPI